MIRDRSALESNEERQHSIVFNAPEHVRCQVKKYMREDDNSGEAQDGSSRQLVLAEHCSDAPAQHYHKQGDIGAEADDSHTLEDHEKAVVSDLILSLLDANAENR